MWVDVFRSPDNQSLVRDTMNAGAAPGLRHDADDARGLVSNAGLTHMGRKRRDVHDEIVETVTRPCLRCRKPFESEGSHHRLCHPCAHVDVRPYAL